MITLNLLPIEQAPRGHWIGTEFKFDWLLVFGGFNLSSETINVTHSHWIPKEERWRGFPKDKPPKWFVDMRPLTPFLE